MTVCPAKRDPRTRPAGIPLRGTVIAEGQFFKLTPRQTEGAARLACTSIWPC